MRRANSPFNLSLLDLLTAALGAVIFLFIITPKGGGAAATTQQAALYFDTTTMQIHGVLPDSLRAKRSGDTLFAMLVDYKPVPGEDAQALAAELAAERKRAAAAEAARRAALAEAAVAKRAAERRPAAPTRTPAQRAPTPRPSVPKPRRAEPTIPPKPAPAPALKTKPDPAYRGTPPSVPARVSFELTWDDKSDNVDLYVCQGSTCVYGNNKRERGIGNWDSGKSRNRLFGNDLRTNQEAVRQFDELLPGTYTVYAHFKESARDRASVKVRGLVYTKDDRGKPRGETYTKTLQRSDSRTRLITVVLAADGTFTTR